MTAVTIETSLVYVLTQDSGVSALVGARVYPLVIPIDSDLPAVAYQTVMDVDVMAHGGATGLRMARVQITCTAETYSAAKGLGNAVRSALSGYQGAAVENEAYKIDSAIVESFTDGFNQTTKTKTVRLDVVFYYTAA